MWRALEMVLIAALLAASGSVRAQEPGLAGLISSHANDEALAQLSTLDSTTPGLAYIRGTLLMRVGDYSGAADALLGELSGLPEALRPMAERRGLQALVRAGRCAEALSARYLSRLQAWPLGRALEAECLCGANSPHRAIAALRAVIRENHRSVDTFALRMHMVESLSETGQRAEAEQAAREAYLRHPHHPEVAQALSISGASEGDLALTLEERLNRASRLDQADRHLAAAAALEELPTGAQSDLRRRWLHARGMALFRARGRYGEAAESLRAAAAIRGSTNAEDAFHAARALSRADRDADAVRAYRQFAARYRTSPRAAQAEFLAGWLEIRHGLGDGTGALRRFITSRRGRANPLWARKARWHLAMAAFDAERYREAARDFQSLAESGDGAMEVGRAWYWLGRTMSESGRRSEAERAWRRTLAVEHLHWYALLAARRLGEMGVTLPPPFGQPLSEEWIQGISAFGHADSPEELPQDVRFLSRWGFGRQAAARLRAQEARWPARQGRQGLVLAYWRVGAFDRAFRLAVARPRRWMSGEPNEQNIWRWAATHPQPWSTSVEQAGARFGVSPAYIYGIMRQESAFAPHVQSYAGAMGLLQLMPETAQRVARGVAIQVEPDELFIPERNIHLGAALSGQLLEEFSGVEALAVGAYNAGSHRIRRWLRDRGSGDLDRFVEAIPINQTRDYIRRVSSHQARYRAIQEAGGAWPPLPPIRVGPELIQDSHEED